jgi:hypothetical protein
MRPLSYLLMAIIFAGCVSPDDSSLSSSSNTPPTTEPNEQPPSSDTFYVNHVPKTGFYRQTRLIKADGSVDTTKKCSLDLSATAWVDRDISCAVDSTEYDLYFSGLEMAYNVPVSPKCVYLAVSQPFFWGRETNQVPTSASVSVTTCNGSVTSATSTNSEVLVNSTTGALSCVYDYSASEGPNCCINTYTLTTTTNTNDTDATCTAPGTKTTVDSSSGKFSGKVTNCLAGPAMDGTLDKAGYPTIKVYRLTQNASAVSSLQLQSLEKVQKLNQKIEAFETSTTDQSQNTGTLSVKAPIEKSYFTNLYISNAVDDGTGKINLSPTLAPFSGSLSPLMGATQQAYEWTCYDSAFEPYGRIRVYVREWNKKSEFDKLLSGQSADPNTTGADDISAIDDIRDWFKVISDGGSLYPGSGL